MPGVVDSLAAPKAAGMFANYDAILPDDDAISVSLNLDGASNSLRGVFLSKETRQVFETEAMTA